MSIVAALLAASVASSEQPARAWDDPERAVAVPNVLVWSSTRTLLNVGFSSTLWQKPWGAMYFAFSFGALGPDAPARYQLAAPEVGVKLGSPRVWFSAGWGPSGGGHFGTRSHDRYGMTSKLLIGVQPLRHLGFFGGVTSFSQLGKTRDSDDQTHTFEGLFGLHLGF